MILVKRETADPRESIQHKDVHVRAAATRDLANIGLIQDIEVLLTVAHRSRIPETWQMNPCFERSFRGDRLVSKVQAETVAARLAHNAGKHCRGMFKGEVRKGLCIPAIPEQGRARAALPASLSGMEPEGRGSSPDHGRRGIPRLLERSQ